MHERKRVIEKEEDTFLKSLDKLTINDNIDKQRDLKMKNNIQI